MRRIQPAHLPAQILYEDPQLICGGTLRRPQALHLPAHLTRGRRPARKLAQRIRLKAKCRLDAPKQITRHRSTRAPVSTFKHAQMRSRAPDHVGELLQTHPALNAR